MRGGFCALRARELFYILVWAACAAGGRWGPVRGCRPSEAPSALPPDDPAGLVVYLHSHGLALKGFPGSAIPRGLRGFCSGSFLASLGDLPARRAMPACAFALNERPEPHSWLRRFKKFEFGYGCCVQEVAQFSVVCPNFLSQASAVFRPERRLMPGAAS